MPEDCDAGLGLCSGSLSGIAGVTARARYGAQRTFSLRGLALLQCRNGVRVPKPRGRVRLEPQCGSARAAVIDQPSIRQIHAPEDDLHREIPLNVDSLRS